MLKKFIEWLGFKPYVPFQDAKASEILVEARRLIHIGWERKHWLGGLNEDDLSHTYSLLGALYEACKLKTGHTKDAMELVTELAFTATNYYAHHIREQPLQDRTEKLIKFNKEAKNVGEVVDLLNKLIDRYETDEAIAEMKAQAETFGKYLEGKE